MRQKVLNILIFQAQVFVVFIGVFGLCLVSRLGKHRKGGQIKVEKFYALWTLS